MFHILTSRLFYLFIWLHLELSCIGFEYILLASLTVSSSEFGERLVGYNLWCSHIHLGNLITLSTLNQKPKRSSSGIPSRALVIFLGTNWPVCFPSCPACGTRERPWSVVLSPEDHSSLTLPQSRRHTSLMPFHGNNLSKSLSISNIAGWVGRTISAMTASVDNIC